MFHRLFAIYATGATVYAIIRNQAAEVWNGTAFVAYNAANWGDYDVVLAEQGATGAYTAAIPAGITATGVYAVTYHRQMGSSPAVSDPTVFEGAFGVGAYTAANVVQVAGNAVAASGTVTFPAGTLASTTNITSGASLSQIQSELNSRSLTGQIQADLTQLLTDVANLQDPRGSGADNVTVRVLVNGVPLPDADVWITSDPAGANVVAGTLQTNSAGTATFLLDDGQTYYLWAQKDGVNSIRGQMFVAVSD